MIIHRTWYTVNPLLSPPRGGLRLFISSPFEGGGGLKETEGLFEREGLFNLETTMVSVLHKELEYKVGKLRYKKLQASEDENQGQTKPSWIRPLDFLGLWLINIVYIYLWRIIRGGEGRGFHREWGLLTFFP